MCPPENPEHYELLLPSNSQQAEQQKPRMGQDEGFLKPEGRQGDSRAKYIVWFLLLPTWITVFINDPTSSGWFALHPPLQTLAVALFSYGILTLQPTSQPKTKAAGFIRHQTTILLVGLPSILMGTIAVSYNKYLRDARHFTTWHGKLGLLCMIWLVVQIGLGAGSAWYGGALFGGGSKAKAVWKYHRLSGYILFPLMLVTVHLGGGWSHWGEKFSPWPVRVLAYTIAPSLIIGGIYARIR
ncbi:hypothetical protein BDQ17DRAFT_1390890 [Cyathus striatus]|nr:hypothetical protein BDQ17DRAFT_1390890 [Cyathus striatus]